jgi:hypothetical protein
VATGRKVTRWQVLLGLDREWVSVRTSVSRRHRRRTPEDPPPQDPWIGAKGSSLLRLAGRVIFAAQPRAGAKAAWSEENDYDRPPRSEANHPRAAGKDR